MAAGYVYKNASFEVGFRLGFARTFLNAERTIKKTNTDGTTVSDTRGARGILLGNILSVFVNY